jgi:hypothetical protein
MKSRACIVCVISLLVAVSSSAQFSTAKTQTAADLIPRLIKFSGTAKDEAGKPMSGILGMTFALYKEEQGGSPLWLETQNVQADANGHYTALLGSATADGVPLSLFSSAEVHWISTQIAGQPEQGRVLLLSVPYALKAADAETLGGLPVSAFVQTDPSAGANFGTARSTTNASLKSTANASAPATTMTGSGTTDFIPLWTTGLGQFSFDSDRRECRCRNEVSGR